MKMTYMNNQTINNSSSKILIKFTNITKFNVKKVKLIVAIEIQRNNYKTGQVRSRKMVFHICKHQKTLLEILENLTRLKIHSMIQNSNDQASNLIIKRKIGQIQLK